MLQPAGCCLLPPELSLIAGASEAVLTEGLGCSLLFHRRQVGAAVILSRFLPHEDFCVLGWDTGLAAQCELSKLAQEPMSLIPFCLTFPCGRCGANPTLTWGMLQLVSIKDISILCFCPVLYRAEELNFPLKTPLSLWRRVRSGLSWSWMLSHGGRWGIKLGNWGS